MANLGKVVYLTEEQLDTLKTDGTITSNGNTVTFSENDLYVTNDSHSSIDFVVDTNTSSTASSALTGDFSGTLSNGKMIIFYTLHPMSTSQATVKLGSLSAVNLYIYGTQRCTTPFPSGSMLLMVYYNNAFYLVNKYAATV